jgi:hypothetical protein
MLSAIPTFTMILLVENGRDRAIPLLLVYLIPGPNSTRRSSSAGTSRTTLFPVAQTEDRKCRRDLLEFRKRRVLVHGHVGSRSRCPLKVSPQDGCALVGGNLFELDLLTAAAPENRSSTGCSYVINMNPLHVFPEH